MILVDTSVLIDYLKGNYTPKALLLDKILTNDIDFCISSLTYHELLQGSKNEKEFELIKEYFSTQNILTMPTDNNFFEQSAGIYFTLRRHGKTVRSTVDVIIAAQAIIGNHILLHDDKDFDIISDIFSDLKSLNDFSMI